ncbi:branched-chain amino acid aminotransferase [Microbotryum lychnidis-dioicae p1A1 Lamole]|uniref:Branched-chain amino acid aminotransferase n=1 Tax=Microbotryum lychnidis-dioicae (strain p1A1 Lamole / MvSl-1064) TaxID=683840 RepID=U5GZM7_USTV1|nr:branched-chain amino acid aminotransferase [Microbotryum lychnidis-dioicae p1A1 Lamole]|eukprot:KDE09309.1 branched-chain amino acid aminotransferase [Microbotryum lychnidis-dioicae p1A1 Lamole]
MPAVVPPSDTFAWDKLAFALYPTSGYVSYTYKDGAWGKAEWVSEPYLKLHVGSVALNYGASTFEGLKAFRHPDGQVRLFRPKDNAARIQHSAEVVSMPPVPEELFLEAVSLAVGRNLDLVPPHAPHGASGSMYVRPLAFASGENLILAPPSEFQFIVYVTPTGSLYGTAGLKAPAIDAFVLETFDRAAPRGVGHAKLAGNYAPTFRHAAAAKQAGYAITLHLDSATRTQIDEFSTSNFLAIKKRSSSDDDKVTLVVPTSESILKSVTTKAIIGIAESFGWTVDRRIVKFSEVIEGAFEEVAACGTAAALTPIRSITYHDTPETTQKISIGDGVNAGPRFLSILSELTGIQSGTIPDKFDWTWPKEGIYGSK